MNKTEASPSSGEARGLKHENLVIVTRPTILQILGRFLEEVKEAKDISPFLDRIMEDLDRPGQDAIVFDSRAKAGERFAVEAEKDPGSAYLCDICGHLTKGRDGKILNNRMFICNWCRGAEMNFDVIPKEGK